MLCFACIDGGDGKGDKNGESGDGNGDPDEGDGVGSGGIEGFCRVLSFFGVLISVLLSCGDDDGGTSSPLNISKLILCESTL